MKTETKTEAAKHTPGPWDYTIKPKPGGYACVITGNHCDAGYGDGLAAVTTGYGPTGRPLPREEWEANACLIAALGAEPGDTLPVRKEGEVYMVLRPAVRT